MQFLNVTKGAPARCTSNTTSPPPLSLDDVQTTTSFIRPQSRPARALKIYLSAKASLLTNARCTELRLDEPLNPQFRSPQGFQEFGTRCSTVVVPASVLGCDYRRGPAQNFIIEDVFGNLEAAHSIALYYVNLQHYGGRCGGGPSSSYCES